MAFLCVWGRQVMSSCLLEVEEAAPVVDGAVDQLTRLVLALALVLLWCLGFCTEREWPRLARAL
jgi:hypothetical protein